MGTLLSAANWPIVGQIAILLGKVMNVIYNTLDNVLPTDHGLVGWSIIIYTILVYTLMLPLTVNQQKTSRMTALMNQGNSEEISEQEGSGFYDEAAGRDSAGI